jgi:hypothetical protein
VAVERTLEALVTRDLDLLPAAGDAIEAWDSAFGAWSDHFSGPPTVLEFKQQDGAWWLVTATPRTRRAADAEGTGQAPAASPPREPAPWSSTISAGTHALLWLESQRAAPDGVAVMGGDLWVDPAEPALGVVGSLTLPTTPVRGSPRSRASSPTPPERASSSGPIGSPARRS